MFSTDINDQLRSIFLYRLFKDLDGPTACAVANRVGVDPSKLEHYLYAGAKLNFCWLEKKAELDQIDMNQFNFGQLKTTDPRLHEEIKPRRKAFQQKWHNDWKSFVKKIEASHAADRINDELVGLSLRGVELSLVTSLVKLGRSDLVQFLQQNPHTFSSPSK